ncbi:hypothetical protein Tco_1121167 [Tanacetum coccineum]|uniref:Uncharacterized protein n=1 Tax=Tanacetum coccineum TaxID=301880 RepID=A0ABQ5IWX0_9ASTR
MASMNTRLNIKKLNGNIVHNYGGSKQVGFKQLGPGVETGVLTNNVYESGVTKHLGVAGIQQQNRLVKETNVTILAKSINLGIKKVATSVREPGKMQAIHILTSSWCLNRLEFKFVMGKQREKKIQSGFHLMFGDLNIKAHEKFHPGEMDHRLYGENAEAKIMVSSSRVKRKTMGGCNRIREKRKIRSNTYANERLVIGVASTVAWGADCADARYLFDGGVEWYGDVDEGSGGELGLVYEFGDVVSNGCVSGWDGEWMGCGRESVGHGMYDMFDEWIWGMDDEMGYLGMYWWLDMGEDIGFVLMMDEDFGMKFLGGMMIGFGDGFDGMVGDNDVKWKCVWMGYWWGLCGDVGGAGGECGRKIWILFWRGMGVDGGVGWVCLGYGEVNWKEMGGDCAVFHDVIVGLDVVLLVVGWRGGWGMWILGLMGRMVGMGFGDGLDARMGDGGEMLSGINMMGLRFDVWGENGNGIWWVDGCFGLKKSDVEECAMVGSVVRRFEMWGGGTGMIVILGDLGYYGKMIVGVLDGVLMWDALGLFGDMIDLGKFDYGGCLIGVIEGLSIFGRIVVWWGCIGIVKFGDEVILGDLVRGIGMDGIGFGNDVAEMMWGMGCIGFEMVINVFWDRMRGIGCSGFGILMRGGWVGTWWGVVVVDEGLSRSGDGWIYGWGWEGWISGYGAGDMVDVQYLRVLESWEIRIREWGGDGECDVGVLIWNMHCGGVGIGLVGGFRVDELHSKIAFGMGVEIWMFGVVDGRGGNKVILWMSVGNMWYYGGNDVDGVNGRLWLWGLRAMMFMDGVIGCFGDDGNIVGMVEGKIGEINADCDGHVGDGVGDLGWMDCFGIVDYGYGMIGWIGRGVCEWGCMMEGGCWGDDGLCDGEMVCYILRDCFE